MSEMVERVAKAIALSDEPHQKWEDWPERSQETFRANARSAIEAMREPTERMVLSLFDRSKNDPPFLAAWFAMIDEALR